MDHPAQGAAAPARRWPPAGSAGSRWLATAVLAAAAGVVMLTALAGPAVHQDSARLLVPLLAGVWVVVLRRWPVVVLGGVMVGAGVVTAWGSASLPFGVLLGLALYFPVLGLPRRRSVVLALAVGAGLAVAVVYSALAVMRAQVPAEVVESFVPVAGAWFIADSVAARRRYEAGLAAQAERERAAGVGEERVRIAREMHDVIAHTLAVMTVQAGVGRRLAGKRPQQAAAALESIETVGRMAQDELHVVLGLLREGEGGAAPLAPAPRLADVKTLADTVRAAGIAVQLRMEGTGRPLPPSLELSVYRVVQEALTNVVKHAPGARAVVGLTVAAGKVRLDVRDDGGPGGAAPRAGLGAGHGIAGMRERIGAFGGWLAAGPAAGGGFQVTAEVPVEGAAS